MKFGEKLINARAALKLSQDELCAKAGVSRKTIYSYEQGGIYPRKAVLDRLAAALGVTAAYLMDEGEEDPRKDLERESFLSKARKDFGYRGAKDAERFIDQAAAMFAGGELDEESKDLVFQSLTEVYFEAKAKAREKFTPKSKKKRLEGH